MKELNEKLRAEMVGMIAKHGALSSQAIAASQELDRLIEKVQKQKSKWRIESMQNIELVDI